MRSFTASASAGLRAPWLEAPEAAPLYGCGEVVERLADQLGAKRLVARHDQAAVRRMWEGDLGDARNHQRIGDARQGGQHDEHPQGRYDFRECEHRSSPR